MSSRLNNERQVSPTYYVRHVDGSYSVADPQPSSSALAEALCEIIAINGEDQGTFRKRGGTRRGLSIVAARAALAKDAARRRGEQVEATEPSA